MWSHHPSLESLARLPMMGTQTITVHTLIKFLSAKIRSSGTQHGGMVASWLLSTFISGSSDPGLNPGRGHNVLTKMEAYPH